MFPSNRGVQERPGRGTVQTGGLALLASLCRLAVVRKCFGGPAGRAIIFSVFCHGGPYSNNFTVYTKLRRVVRCVRGLHFSRRSVACLEDLNVFRSSFLRCLDGFEFANSVCTVPRKAIVFPERPVIGIVTPVVRTRLMRATVLGVVGRRDLVTAGTTHMYRTTGNSPVVRFNLHHTRNPSTKVFNTETTIVNKYTNASGMLANRVFGIPILKARTRS